MASGVAFTGRILKKICDPLLASGGESLLGHVIMLSHTWTNRLFDCLFPQHLTISVVLVGYGVFVFLLYLNGYCIVEEDLTSRIKVMCAYCCLI